MKASLKEKFKYYFDNTLSKGTGAIVVWLTIITILTVLLFALIYDLSGINFEDSGRLDFFEAFWQSLLRTIDPGTVANDTIWTLRIIGIIITFFGIFIFSALIGIISTGLDTKLQELRKGRSKVLTTNHTLIIGWSAKIIHIIKQLIIANENQTKASIVILANKDKVEMEDEIREKIPDTKNTRIICRTGSALEFSDLTIANPDAAKSIIILAPEDVAPELHDVHIIKAILSLSHYKHGNYSITTEISDKDNISAAEIVGKNNVSIIYNDEVIAKITAQTANQEGLSQIYLELLSFEGNEIYIKPQPELTGKTYKELLHSYETSCIIGIKKDDKILINPPANTLFEKHDQIIAISEDDDTVILSNKKPVIDKKIIRNTPPQSSITKQSTLILGWNEHTVLTILELDEYREKGSNLTIILKNERKTQEIEELKNKVQNINISVKIGDYSKLNTLQEINPVQYDTIIIMSDNSIDPQISDAITLLTLIHLRNICKSTSKQPNIISQMLDSKNRRLAEIAKINDFIISNDLISRILAQVSEQKDMQKIYKILFSSEGSEIYLKDADLYVETGKETNFYTIVEAAAQKNETAIGYKINTISNNIVLNPSKQDRFTLNKTDKIIVLAED